MSNNLYEQHHKKRSRRNEEIEREELRREHDNDRGEDYFYEEFALKLNFILIFDFFWLV